jgi:anaerobic selenocysteine-containing dehydrogenase
MIRRTLCNRDCPDACSIVATVEEGRVVRLQGDKEHPVTRGFLCHRTSRFLERQYDPGRLTTPLRRRGDELVPVSWEEALDEIAGAMLRIREESGGAAILHYRCGGSLGMMKRVSDGFFEAFGPVTVKSGDICAGAGSAAQQADFGVSDSSDLFDLLNSRTIVLWGKNVHVSSVHLLPVLRQARKKGARLVLVDPVRHRGANFCDLFLQPRPGGDLALALGVARLLFEGGHTDPAAGEYCDHLEDYRALALSRAVEEWASTADVRPDELRALAEAYSDGPSAILVGWGLQRRTRGSAAVRALDALGAVSGNLGVAGGGVSFYFRRSGAFDTSFAGGPDRAPRAIPEPLLGRGILEASDPPIRMVWVTAANPVTMLPDSRAVARALESRELTVVVDSFLTDTAHRAHIVLPTTTLLEEDDLLGAYGHHWIGESRPVVEPPAGVRSDHEILRALAPRLAMEGGWAESAEHWKRRMLGKVAGKGASLEELGRGAVRNPLAARILFEDRVFPTPSGRVNLLREVDPDPPLPPPERPLFLLAVSTDRAQSSQWSEASQRGPATVTVHPDAAPGMKEGQRVRVESELGSLEALLSFDEGQRRDLLLMDKGGWLGAGRCANLLVSARETDAGGGAVYYDTPVRVGPA